MPDPAITGVWGWTRRVREQIYEHVWAHPDSEVGGVLVGQPYETKGVNVRGVIPALEAVGQAAAVTFTHDAWERVHAELDARYPDDQIVGWYHSHPGLGVFMSRDDIFIHESFFREWWQVAHVVDPRGGDEAMFGWRDGRVVELGRRATDRKPLGIT